MNDIHQDLMQKKEWYRKWHENPAHVKAHWLAFFLVVIISSLVFRSAFAIPVKVEQSSARASAGDGTKVQMSGGNGRDNVLDLTKKLLKANADRKDVLSKETEEESPKIQSSLSTVLNVTKERRVALADLIKKNPKAAIELSLGAETKADLPDEVSSLLEQEVTLTGKIDEIIFDKINNGSLKDSTSEHNFYLTDSDTGEVVQLYLATPTNKVLGGKKVRVKGVKLDGNMAASSVEITGTTLSLAAESQIAGPIIAVPKKTGVILMNFTNDSSQPFTKDTIKSTIYASSSTSAKTYYTENSFGAVDIQGKVATDGDVYGWYTINYPNTDCSNSALLKWAAAADAAAAGAGFDRAGYDITAYAFPNTTNCPFSGATFVGSPYVFFNGAPNQNVATHEFGHTFRLFHADGFLCYDDLNNRVTLSNRCNMGDYGDPFDTMGSGYTKHFNSRYKGQTGLNSPDYLAPENKATSLSGGTYVIKPIERASSGIMSLFIPREFTYYDQFSVLQTVKDGGYYVEFRQPGGFDNFPPSDPVVNGVTVRLGSGYTSVLQSLLLDMNPGTATFSDAPLALGKTFTDTEKGIGISVVALDATGATVRVTMPATTCVTSNPTMTIVPASAIAKAGDTLTYTATITNNDNSLCGASTFDLAASLPGGFTQTPESMSEVINPGNSIVKTLLVTSNSSTTPATYKFTETTKKLEDPTSIGSAVASYVINPPLGDGKPPVAKITAPPDGTIYTKDTTVKVTGTGTDADGIKSIDLWVDTTSLGSCSGVATCTKSLNTRTLSVGTHTITVNVTDKSGDKSSTTITISKTKPGKGANK